MKLFLILITSCFLTQLIHAQNTIIWKGGAPGRETAWNDHRNWDQHRIPDENDKVIIKLDNNGHFAQPVINSEVRIAWLEIYNSAELTITSTGQLIIDGTYTYSEGITMYGGQLNAESEIIYINIDQQFIHKQAPAGFAHSNSYKSSFSVYFNK